MLLKLTKWNFPMWFASTESDVRRARDIQNPFFPPSSIRVHALALVTLNYMRKLKVSRFSRVKGPFVVERQLNLLRVEKTFHALNFLMD